MADLAAGLLVAALLSVLLIFSVPGILLGTASPWAVRLSVRSLDETGHTAGRLYATATAGSIVGTFLPVLLLIPAVGTRWTFFISGRMAAGGAAAGQSARSHTAGSRLRELSSWRCWPCSRARAARCVRAGMTAAGAIVYEDESVYNYIVVREWGSERHLKLNEGVGLHSVYHPDMLLEPGHLGLLPAGAAVQSCPESVPGRGRFACC